MESRPMNIALILAGGVGRRAGGPLPKQFQSVNGERILWRSMRAFREFDPECRLVAVMHPDYLRVWDEEFLPEAVRLKLEVEPVAGGSSRIESVRNGLKYIATRFPQPEDAGVRVFIHDSARPLVSPALISRGAKAVAPGIGAVPVIPLADSIRMLTQEGSEAVDRSRFVAVQTPQVFMLSDILPAYVSVREEKGLTDDASVAGKAGLRIATYEGDTMNFKVTNPQDFKLLETWM